VLGPHRRCCPGNTAHTLPEAEPPTRPTRTAAIARLCRRTSPQSACQPSAAATVPSVRGVPWGAAAS